METNNIDHSANIDSNIILGKYNIIGKNVEITSLNKSSKIIIGDNNIFHDNTRVLVGKDFIVGDWNVFHNNMLVLADEYVIIGHNCWFGQNTILDGSGGLIIGNGVRVGMYSQIWTHVASGELIEGCNLFAKRQSIISDEVWLVGSCVVGSGVQLSKRSTFLINSVITKNSKENILYAGSPAKEISDYIVYRDISLDEKFNLLYNWLNEFNENNKNILEKHEDVIILMNKLSRESSTFYKYDQNEINFHNSEFFLESKTYTKTNKKIEREIYSFLYGNKARFIPLDKAGKVC